MFTPNHRWVTEKSGETPVIKRFMDFAPDDRIVTSRPADTGVGLPISDEEASILGWLTCHDEYKGMSKQQRDDLIARVGDPRANSAYQVIQMSELQRKSWLVTAFSADGTAQERADARVKLHRYGIAEAINLALYLEGYEPQEDEPEVREVSGFKPVWCVGTDLGTWTTKRGEEQWAVLTGNSLWNPFTSGSGGRGLIGWTPEGTISNAAFSGGMATQLPAIIAFINSSGDQGVINEMLSATSVLQAANEWGKGVERYGINDVHAEGVALATSFMNSPASAAPAQSAANAIAKASQTHDAGGFIYPGMNLIENKTGRIERSYPPGEGPDGDREVHAHVHIDGREILEAITPLMYQKASRNNGNGRSSGYFTPGGGR